MSSFILHVLHTLRALWLHSPNQQPVGASAFAVVFFLLSQLSVVWKQLPLSAYSSPIALHETCKKKAVSDRVAFLIVLCFIYFAKSVVSIWERNVSIVRAFYPINHIRDTWRVPRTTHDTTTRRLTECESCAPSKIREDEKATLIFFWEWVRITRKHCSRAPDAFRGIPSRSCHPDNSCAR